MIKKPNNSSGRGGPPNPIDIHIGNRIRAKRRLLGLGQQEFATALGITFQQVQKYEKGQNRISGSRLYDISRVLGTDINFFYEDMPTEVEKSSPRQRAGIKDKSTKAVKDVASSSNFSFADFGSTESMEFLRNYNNIPKKELKKQVFDLCKLLSKENVGRKPKGKKD